MRGQGADLVGGIGIELYLLYGQRCVAHLFVPILERRRCRGLRCAQRCKMFFVRVWWCVVCGNLSEFVQNLMCDARGIVSECVARGGPVFSGECGVRECRRGERSCDGVL